MEFGVLYLTIKSHYGFTCYLSSPPCIQHVVLLGKGNDSYID